MAYKAKNHQETSNPDGSFNFTITTGNGKTPKYENLSTNIAAQMREEIRISKLSTEEEQVLVFEQVTAEQNTSLKWLIQQLRNEFSIPESEIFC